MGNITLYLVTFDAYPDGPVSVPYCLGIFDTIELAEEAIINVKKSLLPYAFNASIDELVLNEEMEVRVITDAFNNHKIISKVRLMEDVLDENRNEFQ